MLPFRTPPRALFLLLPSALALALLVTGSPRRDAQAGQRSAPAHPAMAMAGMPADCPMSDAEMARAVSEHFATHPVNRGPAPRAGVQAAVADTFVAAGFRFDTDGSTATVVDTARITAGEAILWRWVTGIHTVTSGLGSTDPQSGLLFDVPLDVTHTTFSFTFNDPGTYPFYCINHELSNMKGVVVVQPATDVPRAGSAALGFASDPWPSPTSGGVAFRFALSEAGSARAEILDVDGRRIVTLLDTSLPAGVREARWDGRSGDGRTAPPGVYYVRLTLPGYQGSRRVVLTR